MSQLMKGILPNKRWILKTRPSGAFKASCLELQDETVDVSSVKGKEVIVRVETLSVDAFLRTMMDEGAYHGEVKPGQLMTAMGMGTVIAAGPDCKIKVGSQVMGALGAQEIAQVEVGAMGPMKVLALPGVPSRLFLSLLGLTTGLTAWVGIFRVLPRPRRGETVVVSAASGATGSFAAQLAKSCGARVIGVAGGPVKHKFLLDKLHLDAAIDYKSSEQTIDEQLKACAPNGVDFFFDCAGGDILDCVLQQIRPNARIVICGAASQYSGNLNVGKVAGPSQYLKLAEIGATMKGYNVMQYMPWLPWAIISMVFKWARGRVVSHEHVEKGIGMFAPAVEKMFSGGHTGKLLVDLTNTNSAL